MENEQKVYKEWVADGRKVILPGLDGVVGTADDEQSNEDDLDKLKEYMYKYGVITEEDYKNVSSDEIKFKFLDIADGLVISDAVKEAYNTYFKTYYKNNMDTRNGTFENKIKNKATTNYGMKNEEEYKSLAETKVGDEFETIIVNTKDESGEYTATLTLTDKSHI